MDRRTFIGMAVVLANPGDLANLAAAPQKLVTKEPFPPVGLATTIKVLEDVSDFGFADPHFFFALPDGRTAFVHKACPLQVAEEYLSQIVGKKVHFVIQHPAPKAST
jgi:hypothetical protein